MEIFSKGFHFPGATMEAEWFGARLKEIREKAGLTQPALADLAGMNRFGIAKLEQGVTKPSWETVVALCKTLGVSCDAFMQAPSQQHEPKRGRPSKPHAEPEEVPAPKKRGQPKKDQ